MYGILNSRGNRLAFSDDSAYYLLCALEILDDDGNFQGKADMFSKRTIQPHKVVTSVDTAVEALTISIGERACVDLGYMSSLSGKPTDALATDLKGIIFHDPKCRYMDELTGGRGVIFATGTPVSNSMTELYTMQRYLQYDRLQEMGIPISKAGLPE